MFKLSSKWVRIQAHLALLAMFIGASTLAFAGCERKERVIEVHTPGADVHVDRNIDTGKVEVDAKHK
jgi:hypothetical protein